MHCLVIVIYMLSVCLSDVVWECMHFAMTAKVRITRFSLKNNYMYFS